MSVPCHRVGSLDTSSSRTRAPVGRDVKLARARHDAVSAHPRQAVVQRRRVDEINVHVRVRLDERPVHQDGPRDRDTAGGVASDERRVTGPLADRFDHRERRALMARHIRVGGRRASHVGDDEGLSAIDRDSRDCEQAQAIVRSGDRRKHRAVVL